MSQPLKGFSPWLYRYRFLLTLVVVAGTVFAVKTGVGKLMTFSAGVDRLNPDAKGPPQPRALDTRTDIWFDRDDEGLRQFREIEAKFVADDTLLIAFEEPTAKWGAFSDKALSTIAKLTAAIEKVPHVRRVRSLTSNPWIRWGEIAPGERGLIVTDLFEKAPDQYSAAEKAERVVAVMGAKLAEELIGAEAVAGVVGSASKADFIGEPRLINGVISADGRTTALMVQLLRPPADPDLLGKSFKEGDPRRDIAPAMYANEMQWQALDAIHRAISAAGGDYTHHLAGLPAFEKNFLDVGTADMKIVGGVFIIIFFALILIFRRVSGVILPMLVMFASILGMMGAIWSFGDLLNNLTAIAPNMITAIAIANAVHLLSAYFLLRRRYVLDGYEAKEGPQNKTELMIEMIRRNALPVFLTSITTAAGFLSLTTSDIIPMRKLGYTGGIGTILAYLMAMTLLPALLSLFPLPKVRAKPAKPIDSPDKRHHFSHRLVGFVTRRRIPIVFTTAALVVVAIFGLARVEISSDFRVMFPPSNPVIRDLNWIEKRLTGAGDLEIVFEAPEFEDSTEAVAKRQQQLEGMQIKKLSNEVLSAAEEKRFLELQKAEVAHQRRRIAVSAEFLAQVDRFEKRVLEEAKIPGSPVGIVANIDSAIDVLRKINQVQNEGKVAFYRVPNASDVPREARKPQLELDEVTEEARVIPAQTASTLAAQYYLQYENGAKPSENLSRLVSGDRRTFRLSARLLQAPSLVQLAAFDRIRQIAEREFPQLTRGKKQPDQALSAMTLTGKLFLFANMGQRFTYALISSISLALLVITCLIALIFRSLRLAIVSLIPNVLPLVVPLGFFGVFGIPLDGPAIIVAAVALGVCVDDTIHFFSKFSDARRAGMNLEDAVRYVYQNVGGALTFTSVILMMGFAVLALSSFRPNYMIGTLSVVMIGLAWIADFIVTPAYLGVLMPKEARR